MGEVEREDTDNTTGSKEKRDNSKRNNMASLRRPNIQRKDRTT
jgi:hypothetical protein